MNDQLPKRLFSGWLMFCISLSVIGYIGDILIGPSHAVRFLGMLPMYFLMHFIFQIYIILPAIVLYFYLFKAIKGSLLLKMIFLGMLMLYIESFLRPDDWNLTVGKLGDLKQQLSYAFASVFVVLFDERYGASCNLRLSGKVKIESDRMA